MPPPGRSAICFVAVWASYLLAVWGMPALADDGAEYKLTAGYYRFSDQTEAWDLNLRRSSDTGNLWLGAFRYGDADFRQWRAGWDRTLGQTVRLTPSLQWASGGFIGGSLQVESGEPWFVGAGIGRTNLRPYWNLNFDPNDALTLSAGHRGDDRQLLMVQWVQDNRENPDQRHIHFVWRESLPGQQRLTLDVLNKQGRADEREIRRWGMSLTWDWPRWFMRLAWDPNTNFSSVDSTRLSFGLRF